MHKEVSEQNWLLLRPDVFILGVKLEYWAYTFYKLDYPWQFMTTFGVERCVRRDFWIHTPWDEFFANPKSSMVANAQQAPDSFMQSNVDVQF